MRWRRRNCRRRIGARRARKVLYSMPLEALDGRADSGPSVQIGMAANPCLRPTCIDNMVLLDGLKLMHELAEEYDFDVLITKVDSTGKLGIVLEDGMVVARNDTIRSAAKAQSQDAP